MCKVRRALPSPSAFCVAGWTSHWAEAGTQSYVLGLGVRETGLLTLVLGMKTSLGLRGGQNAQGWRAVSLRELSACLALGLVLAALTCILSAWGSSSPFLPPGNSLPLKLCGLV